MKVIQFRNSHQTFVDNMLLEIQKEFKEPITSSASQKMKDANKMKGTRFWVAMDDNIPAGTVGIIKMNDASCALKSFFIPLQYRGSNVAKLLLDTVLHYAQTRKISKIYLGTMEQMKAAQRFYTKNGFIRIGEKNLPKDFPANKLDTVFFMFNV